MDAPAPPQPPAPRPGGLGDFAAWPDELVVYLLAGLELRELLALSQASKLMRVLCCEEPMWAVRHLQACKRPFDYRGSWRATFMAHHPACGRPALTAADLVPLAPVPGFSSPVLYRRWYRCHVDVSGFLPPPAAAPAAQGGAGSGGGRAGAIPYIADASGMGAAEFEARFDGPGQPVLLGGLAAAWPGGLAAWQPDSLAQRLGGRLVRVTKPFFTGGRTRMALGDYLAYAQQQHDEEPLYIFDAGFAEALPELAAQYAVPPIFAHDLFACLAYKREDYRWLVAGPARSGASWHVDPSATSAWNTLLAGRKRWALYPPGRVPPGVSVAIDDDGMPDFQTPTSLQWFLEVYPQLAPDQRPLEVLQQAGDTIFVPAGWWHCVLNLDFTVAVTQNFVGPANLEAAVQWQALGAGAMFDPLLVPTFLKHQAQEEGGAAEEAAADAAAQPEGASPPAKRRRRERRARAPRCGAAAALDSQGQEESEAERAEREAAAEEHLSELTLGWAREGFLAPWLRRLLQQLAEDPRQQALAERVWQLAQQWGDTAAWRPRVEAACATAGLPPPAQRHEWLPLATGWCVVFEVSGAILKFYQPHAPHSCAMACMEAAAYLCQDGKRSSGVSGGSSGGSGSTPAAGPRLLGAGVLEVSSGSGSDSGSGSPEPLQREAAADASGVEAAEADAAPLPFVAVQKAEGVTLGSCMDALSERQWLAVAAAAGRSLAAFHATPLPAAAASDAAAAAVACGGACGCASSGAASGGGACTAWIARDGIVYSSTCGTLDMREEEAGSAAAVLRNQHQALRRLFPAAAAALGQPAPPEPAAPAAAAGGATHGEGSGGCPTCRAWQPFLSFLRRQRKHAAKAHRREGSLPPQLQEQLESYLPADPAVLVGRAAACSCAQGGGSSGPSSSASSRGGMPTWVHGDLTAENLLLSEALLAGGAAQQAEQQAQQPGGQPGASGAVLIDFADAGHGDPLWDFVPLLLRSLRCSQPAAEACMAAYRAAAGPAAALSAPQHGGQLPPGWPARPEGVSLSYAATCYTLLHELGPVHDIFKRRPQLWEAASWAEVQRAVFGWLDALG